MRREELASLSGTSVEYIVRLEQGRSAHPSQQVLLAISRALDLSETEREHLFVLAGLAAPDEGRIPRAVTPGVTRIVDRLSGTTAAIVCTLAWEMVYWNPLWAALLGDPTATEPRSRNYVWRHFTDALTTVGHTPSALAEFEHDIVCDLRRAVDRFPAETELAQMCDELARRNSRFADLWDCGDVAAHHSMRKTVNHPRAGTIAVDCDVLAVPESELYVVVFTAEPGSEDARRLSTLSVTASTEAQAKP